MKHFWIILIYLLFLGSVGQLVAQEKDLPQLVQKQYQSIRSFSGRFIQSSHRADSETGPKEAKGLVYYKRPGKMRWLYEAPEEQLLVTNGQTMWLYDPLLENITVQKLEKITEGTALSFLLGLGNLKADFFHREISKNLLIGKDGLILELEPKKSTANFTFIQFNVPP
jgi:periplasmic chaperone LolA